MSMLRELKRGTVVAILVVALLLGSALIISAATQSISGDPIDVNVFDAGRIEPYYDNWASGYQYFAKKACNNVLWLNGNSTGFDCPDTSTADCPACTNFTAVSNSQPDAWTIETVYDAGSTGVRITQRIEYVNGTSYYNMYWSINNTGDTTYTDLRFMHGGDTYFGGIDSSNGHYDAGLNMVYLTNANVTGIMGLLGTPTSPIDYYIEDHYSTVRSAMNSGNHLPSTVNSSYMDAGYAVEWDRATLAPGDVWEIEGVEKWTAAGNVQVIAPAGQSGYVNDTFNYSFSVQNLQNFSDIFDLSTNSSQGWTVSLPNGSTVTINASLSETVPVQVTATSVGTDVTTLTATSQSNITVTNNDSVTTQAAATAAPNITSYAPESPVNDMEGATRTFNITIDQTVNVTWSINGTQVQLNQSVTAAAYTNTSAATGVWNVSALASNANGNDTQTWIWNVTAPVFNCTCGDICVNETGWWRNGSVFNASATPIQSAVSNATGGETICVKDGNYTENVDVNTVNLTIQSENGTANCVVNASNPNDHVFNVTANWVNITGFTVENATGSGKTGIYLSSADHCNISSNNATGNYYGIYLSSSSDNTLMNNTALNNYNGICLQYSSNNNTLTSNTASDNIGYGIYLYSSSNNNTLTSNTASNNTASGILLDFSSNGNTLISNTANSNTQRGIYLYSSSNNNTLTNNTASNNADYGILLWASSSNMLTNNIASNNTERGIFLYSSSNNNTLTSNTASNNTGYGIYLSSSSNNTIYNNYFNNTNNAYDGGTNTWNTTKTSGTNIIGGPYLGGNYWSDYNGTDTDGDGLGNTEIPYNSTGNIQSGGDYLPLVPGATMEGHVSFTGRGSNNTKWAEPFNVTLFEPGNLSHVLWTGNATTNNTGVFTVSGLTPGSYDIGIKNWTCLSESNTSVTLTVGNTTVVDFGTTREGDANNDDYINILDASRLVGSYGSSEGDPDWNAHCDFNRDGDINMLDASTLASNYGQHGDLAS
jgi:parallel beta-helix repeat protein